MLRHNPLLAPQPAPSAGGVDEWSARTNDGTVATRSILTVSRSADPDSELAVQIGRPIRTGFDALDYWTGNGLRQGELLLLGGAPGAGKTTLCLQMARNIAVSGQANVLYACYEHPPEYVLDRLLVQETINPAAPGPVSGISLDEFQTLLAEAVLRFPNVGPYDALRTHPVIGAAAEELDRYANRFHLVANAARKNDLGTLQALVAGYREKSHEPLVLFVDYLQKLDPLNGSERSEDERVTDVVQALKQLALAIQCRGGGDRGRRQGRHHRATSSPIAPARIFGTPLRGRYRRDHERQVADHRSRPHRLQHPQSTAIPGLGYLHDREEPEWPEPRRDRVPEAV